MPPGTDTYDPNGDLRSVNANGGLLYLTPDYEDRYARFDFDTGPGRGSAYATEAEAKNPSGVYNGLMLLGNRYYDASVGRFISPDKAEAGTNWYAYCGNDPLTKTDPTGLLATGSEGAGHLNPGGNLDAMLSAPDGGSGLYLVNGQWKFASELMAVTAHTPGPAVGQASFDIYLKGETLSKTFDNGMGFSLDGSAAAGLGGFGGAGLTGGGGFGWFDNELSLSSGAYYYYGGFAGTPLSATSGIGAGSAGASASLGLGWWLTNADTAAQLSRTTITYQLNIGLGPLKLGGSYSTGGGIWQFTFNPPTWGWTYGASFNIFNATTKGTGAMGTVGR